MANYDIFRKESRSVRCQDSLLNNLIEDATGSTIIYHRRKETDILVNLVLSHKTEGLETATVYTKASDDVKPGDYLVHNNKNIYITTDEIKSLNLNDSVQKFSLRECNTQLLYGTPQQFKENTFESIDVVFIGTTTKQITERLDNKQGAAIAHINDKAIVIFSNADIDKFDSCIINNRQWTIIDWDDTTANGIVYASIEEVPITLIDKNVAEESTTKYYAGVWYGFDTEDYYFNSSEQLEIKREENKVYIKMPYKNSIEFSIKINGEIVDNNIVIE